VYSPNGIQKMADIPLRLSGDDPNGVGLVDGDLEYKVASVQNRSVMGWSDWKEYGNSDWGDARPSTEPLVFLGEPGMAYRFRYRIRDTAQTYSDFSESANITRINRPPIAVLSAPPGIIEGRLAGFMANASSDPDGDRLELSWDFGDGKIESGKAVSHRFPAAKQYTVTLFADDSLENISVQVTITVRPAPAQRATDSLLAPVLIVALAAATGAAYAVASTRRRKAAAGPAKASAAGVPLVVPGSETRPPAPPPPSPSEVAAQISAAKEAITELERLGIETSRPTKMLGLASSFLADDNPQMASQYSRKAAKLARDMKERLESEVDEETARRYVTDTQKMLELDDSAGLNVKEAKKLFGLSISFLAEGNYVTGMQYSKKVRRILEELRQRQETVPATREAVQNGLEALEASIAELRRAGEDVNELERLVDMARMFHQEEDYHPARQHLQRARAIVSGMKEKGRPFTAQQWKEFHTALEERAGRCRNEGLRTAEPLKMLKLSESFALQGNLEVASQYVRKAQKLLDDIEDRARTRPPTGQKQLIGQTRCPRCGEETEGDWVVCAYCNTRLKAEIPAAGGAAGPVAGPRAVEQIRVARPVEDDLQEALGGQDGAGKKAVKVARPKEK
jgi:tetratricopeptide (TPR) repeat protein